ncbi:MAG: histidine ammonia-lyase [Nitrospinae bacterium]|jgi:histidine ammonia-lyase|nr:histidine ammonia-lyase [Nitrospinota bacterium]MDA1109191.1 histidine ammonia-lyase [Nitrospinota bacterium]
MKKLVLDGESLTLETLVRVVDPDTQIRVAPACRHKVQKSREVINKAIRGGEPVYGITTGFGALSDVFISRDKGKLLQKNILMSHAAGVGNPLPDAIVRLVMALMINSKAKGYSGLRWTTLKTLVDVFNSGIIPEVPEKGSVGASGDLAPLAHLSLVLIGRGKARFQDGRWISGGTALKREKIDPVVLAEGEGLALINGTQVMTAIGVWTLHQAIQLAKIADIAASMSLEVLLGTNTQLHKRIHRIRPHPGQIQSAANMRQITDASEIITSHKDCKRIQDAYSLRCTPQVHGASRDTIEFAHRTLATEINSATENPLVFPDGQILSGGNFHGQPIALAMDHLAVALAEFASISERRIERMVNPTLSGLPSFLIQEGGLNSGFMIAQYTAAALVSENKVLAHPASVDSIPTSANKEDHVSMGTIAARKAKDILENLKHVIAIELLCAAQGLDLLTNLKPGKGTLAAYEVIRRHVSHMKTDRELSPDIETITKIIDTGDVIETVEKACGALS